MFLLLKFASVPVATKDPGKHTTRTFLISMFVRKNWDFFYADLRQTFMGRYIFGSSFKTVEEKTVDL